MNQSFQSTHASNINSTFLNFQLQQMQGIAQKVQEKLQVFQTSQNHAQKIKLITLQLEEYERLLINIEIQSLQQKIFIKSILKKLNSCRATINQFFYDEKLNSSQFFIAAIISIKVGKLINRLKNLGRVDKEMKNQFQLMFQRINQQIEKFKKLKSYKLRSQGKQRFKLKLSSAKQRKRKLKQASSFRQSVFKQKMQEEQN